MIKETNDIKRMLGELSEKEYNIYYYKVYENLCDEEIAKKLNILIDTVTTTLEKIRSKLSDLSYLREQKEILQKRILALDRIRQDDIEKLKKKYKLLDIRNAKNGKIYIEIKDLGRDSGARWKRIDLFMANNELDNYNELPNSIISSRKFAELNKKKKSAQISGFQTRRNAAIQQKTELTEILKEAGIKVIDSLEIFKAGEEEHVNDR